MQPVGIEPTSTVLQTAAMTTSAKVAYIGVLDGERSHTIAFTEQCADHYTTNTIELAGVIGFEPMMTISKTVALGQTRRYPNKIKQDSILFSFPLKVFNLLLLSLTGCPTRDRT